MAKSINIGNLILSVIAKTTGLESGLRRGRRSLSTFGKATQQTQRIVGGFNRTLGLVGVTIGAGALVGSLRNAAKEIDKLGKASDKLGISTEKLASLRLAGELTGVAANTMDMALQRMTRRLAEAAKGTGIAKKALKELGLDATKLGRLTVNEQFNAIAGAMSRVETQADRVRLAFKLFDSEGVALVNTLALGSRGLRDVENQARQFGIAIDRDAVKQVENLNDQLTMLGAAAKGGLNKILIDITPTLSKAVTALTEIVEGVKQLRLSEGDRKTVSRFQQFGSRALGGPSAVRGAIEGIQKDIERRILRRNTGIDSQIRQQENFTKDLEARAARFKRDTGYSLKTIGKNNQFSYAERESLNRAGIGRGNAAIFGDIGTKISKALAAIESGHTKIGEAVNKANEFGNKFKGSTALLMAKQWAERFGFKFSKEVDLDPKKDKDVTRSTNRALEKGTLDAYVASRANLMPQKQLDEARKQTSKLEMIAKNTARPIAIAGVGL